MVNDVVESEQVRMRSEAQSCTYATGSKQCTVRYNEIFNNLISLLFLVGFCTVSTPRNWLFSNPHGDPSNVFLNKEENKILDFVYCLQRRIPRAKATQDQHHCLCSHGSDG